MLLSLTSNESHEKTHALSLTKFCHLFSDQFLYKKKLFEENYVISSDFDSFFFHLICNLKCILTEVLMLLFSGRKWITKHH